MSLFHDVAQIADLDAALCREADGLLVFRHHVTRSDFDRFPKLSVLVRIGVGYDRIDLITAAERDILVCNVPDYGTTEIADHAMALVLALRRDLLLHRFAAWFLARTVDDDRDTPDRTLECSDAWHHRLGRIGTTSPCGRRRSASASCSSTLICPTGSTAPSASNRARSLPELLRAFSNVLFAQCACCPTGNARNDRRRRVKTQLPRGAVIVNTARGALMDIDALEAAMRGGHIAGAGLDVIPTEPPVEPLPGSSCGLIVTMRSG